MEENASKGLSLTATIFLTIGLITIAVSIYFIAVAGTKTAQDDMSGLTNTLQQSKFSAYDNSIVSGSQIINVVRQYMKQDAFGVTVTTGKGSTTTYGNAFDATTGEVTSTSKNEDLTNAQSQSEAGYINPSGRFLSKVVTDKNGVVRGLIFQQR
ncbi:ABC transporter permease [Paenibacillus kandeliae]|uniref:ABC transporter permease n=1 Tax=Paenibacillus kandeliae TaxID=3231269 RepID=UPI003458024F